MNVLTLFQSAVLIISAYLLGSIPTAYLGSKWLKGKDIRRYGSGTVSGSMVYEHVARWAVVPVGLFDVGKAALPTWLGLQLDLGMPVAIIAGLAAMMGHNWPLFLRFTGGRGLGCILGIFVVIFPWGSLWLLVFLAIGFFLGDSAPWALAGLVTLPLFGNFMNGPADLVWATVAIILTTVGKRLEANRRPLPPPGIERNKVILRRFFLDRDIASHIDWIRREP
jgi:glycerol-3-phosphate acyltransferase PlsY